MYNKIKKMMTKKQMKFLYFFIFLSFLAMILETASIGLTIPFIQVLIEEDLSPKLIEIFNFLNIYPSSKAQFIIVLLSSIGILFTSKVLFLTYFSYAQVKLIADLRVSLSDKLYNAYLNKPYIFHLQNNSSKLIRNIDEISYVVSLVSSLITLVLEFIVFLGILALVLWYEPKAPLLVIIFFGLFGFLFFKKVQIKAKGWGESRQVYSGFRLKYLREAFASIKDIKILQRSKEITKIFTENNKSLNIFELKQNFVNTLPRLWLEWLVIVAFIFLILFMIFLGRELNYIVLLLGLFAAAAFRIMPSLTRIMNSIQKIIFYLPTINSIYKEFEEIHAIDQSNNLSKEEISLKKQIVLDNINFRYSRSSPKVFKNINLSIKSGTTIGLVGQSGIGKTTLINLILGLIKPTEGTIKTDGINIFDKLKTWQSQIGYVPQDIYLIDDTIRKNVAFALPEEKIDDVAVKKAIKNAKLDGLVNNLSNGLNTKIGEFGDRISGGQRQRIAIARALYIDPKILILDECTNSLDLNTEKEIINEVNSLKGKKTVIIVAHRLSTLENCDHIYKIDSEGLKLEKN